MPNWVFNGLTIECNPSEVNDLVEQLNKPFDVEVASLTSGLVDSGDLAAGAASDPMAIADALISNQKRRNELQQTSTELKTAAGNIPAGEAGDPLRAQLNSEQMRNIEAMGSLSVAAAEGRQALEKLANDGTKAANALAKIQEEQQAIEKINSSLLFLRDKPIDRFVEMDQELPYYPIKRHWYVYIGEFKIDWWFSKNDPNKIEIVGLFR
jgi:hypothetical protein